jgi:hypothetical protein
VWGALPDQCHQLSRLQLWQGVVACSCGQAVVARQGLAGPRGAGGGCPVQAGQHPWGRPAVCGGWAELDGRAYREGIPAALGQFMQQAPYGFERLNHSSIFAKHSRLP